MEQTLKMLSEEQVTDLLGTLKDRFEAHMHRHLGLQWSEVAEALTTHPEKLWSLQMMEESGGEPDVVMLQNETSRYNFVDCSIESPKGRRSICYDKEALEARKANKPRHSAVEMAKEMGVELLTEEQYRTLQGLDKFDLKTSSWVKTPCAIRTLGGAIFCDRRYDHIFVYHNGADSYYAARGFRAILTV